MLQTKVLGDTIDEELNWIKHTGAECKTLSRSIARLRRARKCFPRASYQYVQLASSASFCTLFSCIEGR